MQLHLGDPGSAGTANPAANTTRVQATFGTGATGRAISNTAQIEWASVPNTETYTWISLWDASTSGNFLGRDDLSSSARGHGRRHVPDPDRRPRPHGDLSVMAGPAEPTQLPAPPPPTPTAHGVTIASRQRRLHAESRHYRRQHDHPAGVAGRHRSSAVTLSAHHERREPRGHRERDDRRWRQPQPVGSTDRGSCSISGSAGSLRRAPSASRSRPPATTSTTACTSSSRREHRHHRSAAVTGEHRERGRRPAPPSARHRCHSHRAPTGSRSSSSRSTTTSRSAPFDRHDRRHLGRRGRGVRVRRPAPTAASSCSAGYAQRGGIIAGITARQRRPTATVDRRGASVRPRRCTGT